MKKQVACTIVGMMLAAGGASLWAEKTQPLELVTSLDPQRYAGLWYEVARFQHGFEKSLVGVTADYSLRPDGRINVLNSGYKSVLDGKRSSVKALAWIPDPAKPGALKVRFFGLFAADYLVFGLDSENYQWALVGNDSRGFLWFLSRTPTVPPELMADMRKLAASQGYDLTKLYEVPQRAR
jgi:apolipoprotein D and lipocalin family protein